ncbi:MAG: hypothetical protein U0361_14730 [Nitrospiraceae bacterium]
MLLTIVAYGGGVVRYDGTGIRWFVSRELHASQSTRERTLRNMAGQTRERPGVLLLVSLLERQVSLWPDTGALRELVPALEWEPVVATIVPHLSAEISPRGCVPVSSTVAGSWPTAFRHLPSDNPDELPNRVIQE